MRTFYAIAACAVALKLWLVSEIRTLVLYAPHDDSNFIEHARSLVAGAWFGHYDELTLIKQPFFVFYLSLLQQFGLPLTLAHVALYAGACLVACIAVRPLIANPYALAGLFVVLFFNPIEANTSAWLANRAQINPSLALLVIAFGTGLYLRRKERLLRVVPWVLGWSVAFAAFMLTREEAIWIVPSVVIFAGFFLWDAWKRGLRPFARATALVALVPLTWALANGLVMWVNWSHYGWAVVSENLAPEFVGAYDSLARLTPPGSDRQYPVPKAARMQAYRVSAAARELEPLLEGSLGAGWRANGCRQLGACADIHAGWFIWAFRAAVRVAGHYTTGTDARAYYIRLANEIDDACARGSVSCAPKGHTLSPPFTASDTGPLLANVFDGLEFVGEIQELNLEPRPVTPALNVLPDYDFLVGATATGPGPTEIHSYNYALERAILTGIAVTYRMLAPWFALLAAALLCFRLVQSIVTRRFDLIEGIVPAAASLVGVLSLVFVLAYISTVSFRAFYDEYVGAAFPLLYFAIYLTLTAYVAGLRNIAPLRSLHTT